MAGWVMLAVLLIVALGAIATIRAWARPGIEAGPKAAGHVEQADPAIPGMIEEGAAPREAANADQAKLRAGAER